MCETSADNFVDYKYNSIEGKPQGMVDGENTGIHYSRPAKLRKVLWKIC